MLKKLLLRFINKSIEILLPESRRGAIALLVLNSPESSEVLETATKITDNFFSNSKKTFDDYVGTESFKKALLDYITSNPELEDFSDFLYEEEKGFMFHFQSNFVNFTYVTAPFLVSLNYDDYALYQEYFTNELNSFEEYITESYLAILASINANLIIQYSTDIYD